MAAEIRIGKCLRLAFGFLTVFPVGKVEYQEGDLAEVSFFFPLVGLFLGIFQFFIWWLILTASRSFVLAALFTLIFSAFLTRGLHLDGVADVSDAWGVEKERRREVLKDSRIGTFGVLGLVFVLAMKLVLLAELRHPSYLLWAPLLGRVGVLEVAALFPPLFEGEGLGKELLRKVPLAFFLFWVAVVAFLMGWQEGALHLLKIGIHFGIIYTLGKVFQQHFGGLNGDMLGCIIELGEIVVLFWGRV